MNTHGFKKNLALSGGARLVFAAALLLAFSISAAAQSPAKPVPQESPYKIEYSYKIKWGYADEWLALFQKNHLPLLRALQEEGRILSVSFDKPRYHASEQARWDFRVTITWKNIAASIDPGTEQALIRKLFPDQAAFQREEQRRFELLLEHTDVPIAPFSFE
jgi:hypothetical protein